MLHKRLNLKLKIQVWLRDTIYKRVTPPGKKPGFRSTLTTFLTSAFWVRSEMGYMASALIVISLL